MGGTTREPIPPSKHRLESTVQPDSHAVGEPRPALELEFGNGDDERGFRLGGSHDGITKAAPRGFQGPETIDDDGIDAAPDRRFDETSHAIQPIPVEATAAVSHNVVF